MNQAIGERFPDLELPDHTGSATRLSEIAGKFPLILIFYRGYW
jgi:peroxiredoxin